MCWEASSSTVYKGRSYGLAGPRGAVYASGNILTTNWSGDSVTVIHGGPKPQQGFEGGVKWGELISAPIC